MINRIIISILLLFIFALPTTVFSHAYLEDSIPSNGAIVKENLLEIQLFFSTRIEPLSTFELLNEQEESIIIDQYIVEQDSITGVFVEPLSNGLYIVNWQIIAADGHASDGQFSFEVELEEELNKESIIEEETNQEAGDVVEATQAKAAPLATLWLTLLIILVGLLYILWRRRRKV
jgi:methionine-rich copper-binding protein CopC